MFNTNQQARRRAMWFNGCNKVVNNDENTTDAGKEAITYFAEKHQKRTPEQIEEERQMYTSTR